MNAETLLKKFSNNSLSPEMEEVFMQELSAAYNMNEAAAISRDFQSIAEKVRARLQHMESDASPGEHQ